MRAIAALVVLGILAVREAPPPPRPSDFRFQRALTVDASEEGSPNACALLDAQVYAHSAGTLDDLRIFSAGREAPYAVTLSNTLPTGDSALILNLGLKRPRELSFDLQMPSRPYSEVDLTLDATDFLASATITGLRSLHDRTPTFLGTLTLFDLTAQRLGRNTSLAIAESTFPFLHIELTLTPAPGNRSLAVRPPLVAGAMVPPSRLAQILYTPVAETTSIVQRPRESVARFVVPAHVPVERVTVELDPADHTNFSRAVTISAMARPEGQPHGFSEAAEAPPREQLSGEISRVRLTEAGEDVRESSLSIPAILGSNGQSPATVEVAIQNGDDRPLQLRSVSLEMRERKLCFAAAAAPATLFYGAPGMAAPVYDFGRLFQPTEPARTATLGPEQSNPGFVPYSRRKPLTERYPALLWIALMAVVCVLGVVAFRSARHLR